MSNDASRNPRQNPGQYICLTKTNLYRALLLLVAALILLCVAHPLWLTALGRWLIVTQQPRPADAILVLGGGAGEREQWAAHLYKQGYAPLIITSGEPPHSPGARVPFAEISADYLQELGVPAEAILTLTETTSTYEEAISSLALAQARGFETVIVVSDPFHMRRSAWTFRQVYDDQGIDLVFVATEVSWFRVNRWWTRERDLMAVVGEYQKLAFYLLKGRLF